MELTTDASEEAADTEATGSDTTDGDPTAGTDATTLVGRLETILLRADTIAETRLCDAEGTVVGTPEAIEFTSETREEITDA